MIVQAPTRPAVAELMLRELAAQRDECVAQVVTEAVAIDSYARLSAAETEDLAENVRAGLDSVLEALCDQRPLDTEDVAFLWGHIHRRTAAGVPEGDMMAVVRIFQRVLWDRIVALAEDSIEERAAALDLATPLIGYIDVLCDTVSRAFLEAGEAIVSSGSRARGELMELLLSGAVPEPGTALNTARAVGLDERAAAVVLVAREHPPRPEKTRLRVAANVLARAAGHVVAPLAVVRDDEAIVVLPACEEDTESIVAGARSAHRRLLERGIPVALGASTVHRGLDQIPAAYAEACLALEHVRERAGVLALGGLDVLDYLILRAGDRTAWRLVPASVREFVEHDAAQAGVLSATLLAYAAADLSVKLAARQLFVHPNTVHYRLAKIETQTGCAVRRLHDVALLLTAIRLHGESPPGRFSNGIGASRFHTQVI